MKPTTVIRVRGRKPVELLADKDFVYVGRSVSRQGWKGSMWGNPFRQDMPWGEALDLLRLLRLYPPTIERLPDMPDLETVLCRGLASLIECHHLWVIHDPKMPNWLPELRGKTLGCWCGCWEPGQPQIGCHAVTLARLANRLNSDDPGFSP